MTERIHSILSIWTTLTDTELRTDLQKIIPNNITDKELNQARRLFNNIHNLSLSIKTIHSFLLSTHICFSNRSWNLSKLYNQRLIGIFFKNFLQNIK